MLLTRAPLRLPLGGGGTDFPSYSEAYGGFILGCSIDKYVHVAINPTIDGKVRLKYSKNECVDHSDELENRVAAEALKYFGVYRGIEVATFSDVPESSGLGGSSSFCCALVKGLREFTGKSSTPDEIYADAYHIERILAGQPGGMQDQFFAAHGGAHVLDLGPGKHFKDTSVDVTDLLRNLRLVYTATGRRNLDIASNQKKRTEKKDQDVIDNLDLVKAMGRQIYGSVLSGSLEEIGRVFHTHWEIKKKRDSSVTNEKVDRMYSLARKAGILGGKLLGLGGGGYLLLYSSNGFADFNAIPFSLDTEGTKLIYKS